MTAEYKSNNIKALMQKHGLTIENLAQELNLSVSTINRLLVSEKMDPKLSTLRPVAKFFGISIDELIGDRPLNLKAGDNINELQNNPNLIQVPLIHWEQVKDAGQTIPTLNFRTWDNWAATTGIAGADSYALRVTHTSLPAPFYFRTIIIIDPNKEEKDNDYVVVLDKDNPIICQVIFHGLQKYYKILNLDRTLEQTAVTFCGVIVQWTIPYFGKKTYLDEFAPQSQSSNETLSILKKKSRELSLSQYLLKTVQIADLARLQQLLLQDKTVNQSNDALLTLYAPENETLLHVAVKLGHFEIIKYLIQEGWNINAQNRRLRAPLHYATYCNVPVQTIALLLKSGAELDIKDDDNASPFMWACYLNNVAAAKELLHYKPDLYALDNFGLSALEWAAHQGNIETLELLVKQVPYPKKQLALASAKALENGQTTAADFLEKLLK